MSPSEEAPQLGGVSRFHPATFLEQNFDFQGIIGQGQYGKVWKCQLRATEQPFACKQILKSRLPNGQMKPITREIEVMQRLQGHANIVNLHSVYEDDTSVFMLMELLPAGDLFTQISERSGLPETEARHVFESVARAVKHCHDCGIIHRDIKPENVLLRPAPASPSTTTTTTAAAATATASSPSPPPCGCSPGLEWEVKLADFGLSRQLPAGHRIKGCVGSYPYEAPEVLQSESYNWSADVWSLGVLLYAMLCASWPEFKDGSRALDEAADWTQPVWGLVTEAPKHLIRRMLSVDPIQRPTIDEVLAHPWFSEPCVDVLCPAACDAAALATITFRALQNAAAVAEGAEAVCAEAERPLPHLLNAMVDDDANATTSPAGLGTVASSVTSSQSFGSSNSSNTARSYSSSTDGSGRCPSQAAAETTTGGASSPVTVIQSESSKASSGKKPSGGDKWWQVAASAVFGVLSPTAPSSPRLATASPRMKATAAPVGSSSRLDGRGRRAVTCAPAMLKCSRTPSLLVPRKISAVEG